VLPAGRRVEELGGASEVGEKLSEPREVEIVPFTPVSEEAPRSS
jgi:hypothetical protein